MLRYLRYLITTHFLNFVRRLQATAQEKISVYKFSNITKKINDASINS